MVTHTKEELEKSFEDLLDNASKLVDDLHGAKTTKKEKELLDTIDGIITANTRDINNLVEEIRNKNDTKSTLPNKTSSRQSIDTLIKNKIFIKYIQLI